MTCFRCGVPVSMPTAWCLSESAVLCGPCAREFASWYRQRMVYMSKTGKGRNPSEMSFAEAASTSVR